MKTRATLEWWIAVIRVLAVPFAALQVGLTTGYPGDSKLFAWALTAVLAAGAATLYPLARDRPDRTVAIGALLFDCAMISAFTLLY